ncbi:MAG: SH3 domain-containing protein [Novosphingobium sp.]|uniref:SH3 domain-containing protein n=1 Tax=Novosphingobium sp. TaxID=1874826 RepID=UPI0032BE816F
MLITRRFLVAAAIAICAVPAVAQDAKTPYWASIRRGDDVNMRVGPGEDYRILWVFHRQNLPLKVLRIKEGWRFVEDPGGAKGWVLARFLTRERTGFVIGKEPAAMRSHGNVGAKLLWQMAPGVVGLLGNCDSGWCKFSVGPRKGYVEQARLWGAGEP